MTEVSSIIHKRVAKGDLERAGCVKGKGNLAALAWRSFSGAAVGPDLAANFQEARSLHELVDGLWRCQIRPTEVTQAAPRHPRHLSSRKE